ncbi:MAG TPA: HAD family hydrolase [Gaiella sp.]|jgi:FMN phosphatase YigB (HAD superfamily)
MTLRAVVFDVGETLVDEDRYWQDVARVAGVPRHVLLAALGVTIARGEDHRALWGRLGMERPTAVDNVVYERGDLHGDALPCLAATRAAGYAVALAGNQTAALEEWTRSLNLPVDLVASSVSLGARKPHVAFFAGLVALLGRAPGEVAYVGDRVDNDVVPAVAAGLVAVHVRRGPWGRLQDASGQAQLVVESLAELPAALASLA